MSMLKIDLLTLNKNGIQTLPSKKRMEGLVFCISIREM